MPRPRVVSIAAIVAGVLAASIAPVASAADQVVGTANPETEKKYEVVTDGKPYLGSNVVVNIETHKCTVTVPSIEPEEIALEGASCSSGPAERSISAAIPFRLCEFGACIKSTLRFRVGQRSRGGAYAGLGFLTVKVTGEKGFTLPLWVELKG